MIANTDTNLVKEIFFGLSSDGKEGGSDGKERNKDGKEKNKETREHFFLFPINFNDVDQIDYRFQ